MVSEDYSVLIKQSLFLFFLLVLVGDVVIPSSSDKYRTNPSFASDISSAAYLAADMGSLKSGAHSVKVQQVMH